MLRVVSVGSDMPGVFAVGLEARESSRSARDTVPDRYRRPARRQATNASVLAALAVGWWFTAGQPLVAALF